MWHKKINFVFCPSQFFYIQFLHCVLAARWSFLCGPWKKETFDQSSRVYSSDWYSEAVTKSFSGKKVFLGLIFAKHLWRVLAGFFPTTFSKMNTTVTGIFQGFSLDFN